MSKHCHLTSHFLAAEQSNSLLQTIGKTVTAALPWVLDGLDILAPAAPFFGPVLKLFKVLYTASVAMAETRDNAGVFAERLYMLAQLVHKAFDQTPRLVKGVAPAGELADVSRE